MRKTGLSQRATLTRENFLAYRAAGLDCLEISPAQEEYPHIDLQNIAALAKEFGITLWSFHLRFLPFAQYSISNPEEAMRRFAVEDHKKWIAAATQAGITRFVIHASGEPISDEERPLQIAQAKRSLCELAAFAAQHGAVIAVEDLPRSCLGNHSAELLDLVSCDERLRICFDTNHLLGEDPCAFLRTIAPKLLTTHVSDYDFINERHWLPGEGDMDWKALMDTFDEVGYTGPILYEVTQKQAWNTMVRERALLSADFVQNHKELEARAPLSVIGTRVANLGMWGPENS